MDKPDTIDELIDELEDSNIEDIDVEEHPDGVALTLQKIHFVTNKAEILPEERDRLDTIANVLKKFPDRTFFVIGHTTRIGSEEFLYELSVARAKAIVDALVIRGIPAERFIYEGRGGSETVAPDDTEENKIKNRRVEIIILED